MIFFCNVVNCRRLYYPDEVKVIKDVYRKNNGKEIPEYTQKEWNKNASWYNRLKLFVQSLNKKSLNLRVIHNRLRNFCLVSLNYIEM